MYSSQKPRQQQQQPLLHFYKQEQEEDQEPISEMMIEIQQQPQQNQMIMGESSGGEDHEAEIEMRAPKKRAETWVQEETRNLIAFRRDMDGQFNTSKSNKHLWEQISGKMRDKGFDRSPTMCTDKWRNLLKEFKKARHLDNSATGSVTKMSYYKDIDEILKERTKSVCFSKSPTPPNSSKVESFLQFSDKGMEDTGISFGPVEATGGSTLNLESRLDHDEHPITITAADTVATSVPPWGWRDTPINGGEGQSFCGRVITVKWGDYTRRIGIDGTSEAIKEAIRAAFRLRSKRLFWLEDEYQIVRSLDRDMPLGNYTLHLDEGMAIKVCLYDESDQIHVHTEEKIFYNEEDHRDYLARRGWTCLRELDGFRSIDNLDDLQPGAMYRGVS